MRTPHPSDTRNRRYTPLLIELDDLIISHIEDPPLPEDLLDIDNPIYLSPRYYIKIFRPPTTNTTGSLSSEGQIYPIQRSGVLANKLQLQLRPSIGYGINSCYRVEYWQWEKILLPRGYSLTGVVGKNKLSKDKPQYKHKMIRQEYWYIPNADGSLNSNYNNRATAYPFHNISFNRRQSRDSIGTLSMKRYDSHPDDVDVDYLYSPHDLEVFDICSIRSEDNDWSDYTVSPLSFTLDITKEIVTRAIGISWGPAQPRPTTKYEITYIKPFSLLDVSFLEDNRDDNLYNSRR